MGQKKKNKKTSTRDYYWTHTNLNIHLFAGINKWIYSVSYLERHLNINKQTPSVRQNIINDEHIFFRKALYIHVASCGKVSFPAMLKSQSVQKNLQTENHTAWLRLCGLYIVCSEQKMHHKNPVRLCTI